MTRNSYANESELRKRRDFDTSRHRIRRRPAVRFPSPGDQTDMPARPALLRRRAALALVLPLIALSGRAMADDPVRIEVTIKDHRFTPAEIHVARGKPAILVVHNQDNTAEEFESSDLKVEKVVAAGSTVMIRLRPLGPGRYAFIGEFHPDTATGVVIAE